MPRPGSDWRRGLGWCVIVAVYLAVVWWGLGLVNGH